MRNTLTIGGLGRFVRGTPTPDDQTGVFVKSGGLQGWEGLPAGRRETLSRAVSHGEHDVPVRLPARVITVDVWIIERTLYALRRESQRFRAWGATGDRFQLTVDHQGQVLHATVRRILAETGDTGVRWRRFYRGSGQVQFVAADPRQYGESHTYPETGTGTDLQVVHYGTFPAHPVIEIPSAPSAYTIMSPAGTFWVTGASAGGTHRVDMRTGRVTRNGVWMQGVGRGRIWAVPDGQPWPHTLSVPGRVLIDDTYV